jgi:hypothetical protein
VSVTPGPFDEVKPGDKLTRCLAGKIFISVMVDKVENGIINIDGGWTFDQATGMEIDEDLGFGPKFGITGSYLLDDRNE